MARRPTGLVQRGKIYWIRIRVKEELRPVIGKTELTRSLRTCNFDEALERFWPILAEFKKVCADASRQLARTGPMNLSESMAEHFVFTWFRETLHRVQNDALNSLGVGDLDERLADLDEEEARLISGKEMELLPGLQGLADKILIENSFPVLPLVSGRRKQRRHIPQANVDKGSPGYWKMIELLKRGQLEAIRRERQIVRGKPIEVFDPLFSSTVFRPRSIQNDKNETSLTQLIELYLSAENKSERAELDYRAAFRPLIEVVGGETPIGELTPDHFHAVRNLIRRMPPNATKGNNRRRMTLTEIADDVEARGGKTLSPVSINKYLSRVAALMRWAEEKWYIRKNPARGLTVSTIELPIAKERRLPFSMDALNVIFSDETFTRPDFSKPSMFWAPLISLFHGMRLEEILQLTSADFCDVDGVAAIRIHDEGENHLKRGAARTVPVHPKMNSFGFESLLKSSGTNLGGLLFSDVKRGSENKYGSPFSQRYSRHLKKIGVKTENTSFHSYRHNFRDAGRNRNLGDELTCAIGGWSYGSGVHRNYGSGFWMSKKADAIKKIAYPDVDFSKIKVICWDD